MIWVDTARQAKICKAFLNKYALPIVVQNPDSTVCYYSSRWLNLAWSICSLRLPTSFIFQWEPSLFYSWELEHVANWTLVQKEEDPPPWTSFSGILKMIYVKIWGGNGRLNRNDNQNWYMKVPKPLIIANNSYPNSSNWKWWKKSRTNWACEWITAFGYLSGKYWLCSQHKVQSMKDGQHYGLMTDQLPVMIRLKISTIQFRYDGGIVYVNDSKACSHYKMPDTKVSIQKRSSSSVHGTPCENPWSWPKVLLRVPQFCFMALPLTLHSSKSQGQILHFLLACGY